MNPLRKQIGTMKVYEWACIQSMLCAAALFFVSDSPTPKNKAIALGTISLSSLAFAAHFIHRVIVNRSKMDDATSRSMDLREFNPDKPYENEVHSTGLRRGCLGTVATVLAGGVTYFTFDAIMNMPPPKLPPKREITEPAVKQEAPQKKTPIR